MNTPSRRSPSLLKRVAQAGLILAATALTPSAATADDENEFHLSLGASSLSLNIPGPRGHVDVMSAEVRADVSHRLDGKILGQEIKLGLGLNGDVEEERNRGEGPAGTEGLFGRRITTAGPILGIEGESGEWSSDITLSPRIGDLHHDGEDEYLLGGTGELKLSYDIGRGGSLYGRAEVSAFRGNAGEISIADFRAEAGLAFDDPHAANLTRLSGGIFCDGERERIESTIRRLSMVGFVGSATIGNVTITIRLAYADSFGATDATGERTHSHGGLGGGLTLSTTF